MKEVRPVRTFEDRYRIVEWIKNNEERLKGIRPTMTELSALVEQSLGLQTNPDTLRHLVKLSGVTWELRRGSGGGHPAARTAAARLDKIDVLLSTLRSDMTAVQSTVLELHDRLKQLTSELGLSR